MRKETLCACAETCVCVFISAFSTCLWRWFEHREEKKKPKSRSMITTNSWGEKKKKWSSYAHRQTGRQTHSQSSCVYRTKETVVRRSLCVCVCRELDRNTVLFETREETRKSIEWSLTRRTNSVEDLCQMTRDRKEGRAMEKNSVKNIWDDDAPRQRERQKNKHEE